MLIVTTDSIPTKKIIKVLGLVRGKENRSIFTGKNIADIITDKAKELNANAILCYREYHNSHSLVIFGYGTAVMIEDI